jgi:hypothetical protein
MKLLTATIALTFAAASVPAAAPANARAAQTEVRINKCGAYKNICDAARLAHARAGYAVSILHWCGNGDSTCGQPGRAYGWYYHYWR